MYIDLAKRHWVSGVEAVEGLENQIDNLKQTRAMIDNESYPIVVSLLISAPASLDQSLIKKVDEAVYQFKKIGIHSAVNYSGETAGQKFVKQCLPQRVPEKNVLLTLTCMDQFPLHEKEYLEMILNLGDRVLSQGKLYATGSRLSTFALAVNPENDHRRKIYELILAITGNGVFEAVSSEIPEGSKVNLPYKDLGEVASGCFILDPNHELFVPLRDEIDSHPDWFEKPGFSVDYFVPVFAGMHNSVSTGYVYADTNMFYGNVDVDDEKARVNSAIYNVTKSWVGTSIVSLLQKTLADSRTVQTLSKYFDGSLVNEVVDIMDSALVEE